eukprot:521026-Alexandrium_andersonii.AAC.1
MPKLQEVSDATGGCILPGPQPDDVEGVPEGVVFVPSRHCHPRAQLCLRPQIHLVRNSGFEVAGIICEGAIIRGMRRMLEGTGCEAFVANERAPWAPLEVVHLPPGLPVRLHPREPASVPQHAACPGQTVARERLPTHPRTR